MPEHHLANKSGIVYEHILVAEEKILHRLINNEEVVHHIDEDRGNNNPKNLMVFATKADHTAYHKGYRAIKSNDVYICPDKYKTKICPLCGNKKDRSAKVCKGCRDILKAVRPPKEELLRILQVTKNKSEIGRMFNVSSTSVRKWIKYYNIDLDSVA